MKTEKDNFDNLTAEQIGKLFPIQIVPYDTRYDSFVTHQKMFTNLTFIKDNGMEQFIENQKIRMNILDDLLSNYDDGRSKSFFCICCALLPVDKLREIHDFAQKMDSNKALKERAKTLKEFMITIAHSLNIDLQLHCKKIN